MGMPIEYRSTDVGAPTLTGEAGSWNTLLKTLLVGSGTAYGSKPKAGWTMPFESGNVMVIKGHPSGSGYHFRFDDSGIGPGGTREAMIRAFSSMADIDTGTHMMPPEENLATGGPIRKSSTTNAVARDWMIWADDLRVHWWIDEGAQGVFGSFGDYFAFVPGDSFNAYVMHGWRYNNSLSSGGLISAASGMGTPSNERGFYLGSTTGLLGSPVRCGIANLGYTSSTGSSSTNNNMAIGGSAAIMSYSNPTGRLFFTPAYVGAQGVVRGIVPGLYVPLNNVEAVVSSGDYEYAPSGLPVESRLAYAKANYGISGSGGGAFAIETGLAWS